MTGKHPAYLRIRLVKLIRSKRTHIWLDSCKVHSAVKPPIHLSLSSSIEYRTYKYPCHALFLAVNAECQTRML